MTFKILKSGRNTVLVHEDAFELEPKDYFVGGPSDAKLVGEVEINGDTEHLDDIYNSQA